METNMPGWFDPLCHEVRCEVLKAARNLSFLIPTVLAPLAFYAVFVFGMGQPQGSRALATLVSYCIFCAMAPGLFGVGTSISLERAMGWGALRRASPLRPEAFVISKLCLALLYCALSAGVLIAFAMLAGGVSLPAATWLMLPPVILLAAVFFAAVGLLLGLAAEQGALAALTNLLFLPMALLGGLWFPIQVLHPVLQQVGMILPTYHFGQLALMAAGLVTPERLAQHLATVAAWTILVLVVCVRVLRRRPWYRPRRTV